MLLGEKELPDGVGVLTGLPVGHPLSIRRSSNDSKYSHTSVASARSNNSTSEPKPPESRSITSRGSSNQKGAFQRQTVIAHTNAELSDRLVSMKSADTAGVSLFHAVAREIPDCGAPLHSLLYTYRNIAPNNIDALAKGSEGMLADLNSRLSSWEESRKKAMSEKTEMMDKERERCEDEQRRALMQRAEQVETRISRMNTVFHELEEKIDSGSSVRNNSNTSATDLADGDRHSLEARRRLLDEAKKKAELRAQHGRQAATDHAAALEKITRSRIDSEREMGRQAVKSNFVVEEHLKRCDVRNEENRARIRIAIAAADSMQLVKLVQEGFSTKEIIKAKALEPCAVWHERLNALWKPYREWFEGLAALRTARINYAEANELHVRIQLEASERSLRLMQLQAAIREAGNHPGAALRGIEALRGALHRSVAECTDDAAGSLREAEARRMVTQDALDARLKQLENASVAHQLTAAVRADLAADEQCRRLANTTLDRALEIEAQYTARINGERKSIDSGSIHQNKAGAEPQYNSPLEQTGEENSVPPERVPGDDEAAAHGTSGASSNQKDEISSALASTSSLSKENTSSVFSASSSSVIAPQTLRAISLRYNCSIDDLKAVNPELAAFGEDEPLKNGVKLKLPKADSSQAKKSSAKTLAEVSVLYNCTVDELRAANPTLATLGASEVLPRGTKLVLPARKKSSAGT